MPYVKVKELLAMGKKNHACVLAFDAADVNMIKSVIKGAETAGRPVIVMLYPGMRNIMPFGVFAEVTRYYAERASVPVGLHLDHCSDFDMILEAIHEGFPSVMADGSVLPFEKNAAFTKKVVEVARNFDVDVEGELGHVGTAADSDEFSRKEFFTRPDEVREFVEKTGVTSLAVSFGSAHGLYKSTPKLDIEHLKTLSAASDIPLVLHGGTGIPDDQLAQAFSGILQFKYEVKSGILCTGLFEGGSLWVPGIYPAKADRIYCGQAGTFENRIVKGVCHGEGL